MNNRSLIILAVVVLGIVGVALWMLNSKAPEPKRESETTQVDTPVHENASTQPSVPRPSTPLPKPTETAQSNPVASPKATPRALQAWELKIDEILRSNLDETQTAQVLINMFPTLPAEGQEEAAQHISNLILDKDYSKVLPLVKNPNLPEEVLDVFVTDLMNRDDATKLPALLDIAKIPNHPHHEEALTDLQIFLDEDFGTDWNRWQSAMQTYLKKQQDDEKHEEQ